MGTRARLIELGALKIKTASRVEIENMGVVSLFLTGKETLGASISSRQVDK